MILSFVPEPQTKVEVDMLRDALSDDPFTSAYARLVLWVSYAPELVFAGSTHD